MESSAVTRLVFVGGGRLAGILYSTFHRQHDILGYVDDVHTHAYLSTTYGVPCLGTSAALSALRADGVTAVVSITDAAARKKYGELLDSIGFEMTTLVFPTAVIDEYARVGRGCIIRHQAVISAQVELGRNCVVSDNAYVGHDSVIGAHTYISPGVNINGSVTIGEASFVGTGAVILPERRVGAGCTVGAAACVIADVPDGQTVAGVPARPLADARRAPAASPRPGAHEPVVSVLMASFNHETYVAEAIQSALDQTLRDLELVIVDDGSTDGTVGAIRSFHDPRIRFTSLDRNHGLAVAKRRALAMATGTYVAILNSDDAFLPDKLEKQVRVLQDHPEMGAVFTGVEVIDETGCPFRREDHPYTEIFKQPNRSRAEWLRHFFYRGNCLCAPSVLMHRKRLLEIGYLDRRFRQLADLDLWIRMCFRHPIHIHPEALTRFRARDGDANASAPTPEARVRDFWEYSRLLRHYLRIPNEEELIRIFPQAAGYIEPDAPLDADGIAYVVARLALDHGGQRWEYFALDALFELLDGDARAARIHERFEFGYRELIELTGRSDVFRLL
jgi:sugar O-acyltransferase (sialic acid O-acetyltransferase NeuD family)